MKIWHQTLINWRKKSNLWSRINWIKRSYLKSNVDRFKLYHWKFLILRQRKLRIRVDLKEPCFWRKKLLKFRSKLIKLSENTKRLLKGVKVRKLTKILIIEWQMKSVKLKIMCEMMRRRDWNDWWKRLKRRSLNGSKIRSTLIRTLILSLRQSEILSMLSSLRSNNELMN